MDDQSAYFLGGLLNRHFGLGRVARFRDVQRGRQAATTEVLTAQQNEYLVYMYPPTFAVEQLSLMASAVNRLDEARFSVLPFQKSRDGGFAVPGPNGTHLLVGLNPTGVTIAAADWTDHQLSELGLRLAWMHRALREDLPTPPPRDLPAALSASLALPPDKLPRNQPPLPAEHVEKLAARLAADLTPASQFIHADLSADAVLLDTDRQLRLLLDWALLQPGTPLEDLFWVCINWGGPSRARIVIEAYRAIEPAPAAAIRAAADRALAQRIIDARAGRAAIRPVIDLLPQLDSLVSLLAD